MKEEKVIEHIWRYGEKLIKEIKAILKEERLEDKFIIEGYPCSPSYTCMDAKGEPSFKMKTLFMEKLLNFNIMMPWIALSYAHREKEFEITLNGIEQSLKIYKKAIEDPEKYIESKRIIKPIFRKFN